MRKKSENRSNIIMPLHFGHSITSSQVARFTAADVHSKRCTNLSHYDISMGYALRSSHNGKISMIS
jgi:hypothetical protein